jgi:hypothetical protein
VTNRRRLRREGVVSKKLEGAESSGASACDSGSVAGSDGELSERVADSSSMATIEVDLVTLQKVTMERIRSRRYLRNGKKLDV